MRYRLVALSIIGTLLIAVSVSVMSRPIQASTKSPSRGVEVARGVSPDYSDPSANGHLFTAGYRKGHLFEIDRFPIVNGIVTKIADETMPLAPGVSGFTAGPDGSVYLAVQMSTSDTGIDVFAPGWHAGSPPTRSFYFSGLLSVSPTSAGLIADASGNVYVIVAQSNSLWGKPVSIQMFAASASGYAPPLQTIYPAGLQRGYGVEGLALDPAGSLYVTAYTLPASVVVYGTPLTAPTLLRSFYDTNLTYPSGIAVGGGEVYVTDRYANQGLASAVRAYPIMASGSVNPDRLIGYRYTEVSGQLTMLGHTLYLPQGAIDSNDFWIVDDALGSYQNPKQILGKAFATIYFGVAGP
jgi:hypothetical protein